MRNPKWHRDEIILALDLYLSDDRGTIDVSNPKVIYISQVLNKLPIFQNRPDAEKFRNPNGVSLKLSNFLYFDPNYKGKGMSGGSKLDREVFEEFYLERRKLRRIAQEIIAVSEDQNLRAELSKIEDDEQTLADSVIEGQVLYKLHKVRERDRSIVSAKKKEILNATGKLACEACVFEFEDYYGAIGKGFIECHHQTPLAKLKSASKITLDDLALVCSNCHRMLHKNIDVISINELKTMIRYESWPKTFKK